MLRLARDLLPPGRHAAQPRRRRRGEAPRGHPAIERWSRSIPAETRILPPEPASVDLRYASRNGPGGGGAAGVLLRRVCRKVKRLASPKLRLVTNGNGPTRAHRVGPWVRKRTEWA